MFAGLQLKSTNRKISLVISFALHAVVISILASRAPVFIKPSSAAWGMHGKSQEIVYFARNLEPQSSSKKLVLPTRPRHKAPKPAPPKPEPLRAGSESGSLDRGPAIGIEAQPALPLWFPDPVIYPWQVHDVGGDVVIEITIDAKGNVIDTRVLQSLKHDIDDKCVATLRGWRFKPATVDGVAISSRQDVHFHFPG
jgi:TonB family protein